MPEPYLQKFHRFGKADSQTYLEFGHKKEALFDRQCCRAWWLWEIPWLDVPDRIAIYNSEQKVSKVSDAAVLTDEYVLMHTDVSVKSQSSPEQSDFVTKPPVLLARPVWKVLGSYPRWAPKYVTDPLIERLAERV